MLKESTASGAFLEGCLEGISVPDLIRHVWTSERTGTFIFSRGELSKSLSIQNGRIVFATSNFPEDRLGETLLRAGLIGYKQHEEASRLLSAGKRIGTILVDLGHLSQEDLVRGVLDQVKGIILSLFPWDAGAYRFSDGAMPAAEVITLDISTPHIVYEGVQRITAWPRIAAGVGPPRSIFRLTHEARRIASELSLGAAEGLILDMLEEPTSAGEVCRGVFLPNFDVYQKLWAFKVLGMIREVQAETALGAPVRADARHGYLADAPVGSLLLRLCHERETGVLYLARLGEEKTIHLNSGRVVFATSNRAEDNLMAFLLRRGVIGVRDRDEVERRLLTNKRAGTILREMGILSQDELVRYVREQLREIILALFQWEAGEWRFVNGELATLEGITLDRPVEEWILHGCRYVRDWAKIREGCGSLDTVLKPAESPSAALGGVDLGPDESEVLAATQIPRSIREICASVSLPDYRVGQILWALQMIGATVRARTEPILSVRPRPVLLGTHGDAAALAPALFGGLSAVPESRAPEPLPAPEQQFSARPSDQPGDAGTPVAASPAEDEDRSRLGSAVLFATVRIPLEAAGVVEQVEQLEQPSAVPSEVTQPVSLKNLGMARVEAAPTDPKEGLLIREIDRFNAVHRELYAVLRRAVGAGAKNSVATCVKRLGDGGTIFGRLAPNEAGVFSRPELVERVRGLSPAEARSRFAALVREETLFAAVFLDAKSRDRLGALREKLKEDAPQDSHAPPGEPRASGEQSTKDAVAGAADQSTESSGLPAGSAAGILEQVTVP